MKLAQKKTAQTIQANQDVLYKHVEFLTTLRPFRNYKNLESLEKVCEYLNTEFQSYGLEVSEQKFTVQGNEYKNIIASYNSNKSKRLIVGAHYDVCGDQPGADDNASAVAGLLETARLIATEKPVIPYRVDFVAYCLEEPPFFGTTEMGSYIHAKSMHDQNVEVIGLINYEMIGYFTEEDQPYPHPLLKLMYPKKGNFITVVGKKKYHKFNKKVHQLMKQGSEINVQFIDSPFVEDLAGMSDQRNYWKFDIPGLMINDTAFIRNPNYHEMSDDIDTLNFDMMAKVVSSTYQAVKGL